nr:halocin C8 precursor-like protein [Halobacillus sp. Nhm2S1]
MVLALIVSSMSFSTPVLAHGDYVVKDDFESNVDRKEFNKIRNDLKHTTAYKKYKKVSMINAISPENIIITKVDSGDYAYIEFIFDKKKAEKSSHLVYAQFTYDLNKKEVVSDQGMYAESLDTDGSFNMKVMFSIGGQEVELYNLDVDKEGMLTDIDGIEVAQEKVIEDAGVKIKELIDGQGSASFSSLGVCEYTLAALCGAGGSAGCYAIAVGLGITSGVGGFALATVCGMIGSIGCTAATDVICG